MPNIGPGELILILMIALIFIGPGKLPEVGASIGKSLREFRKASSDVQEATKLDVSVAPIPPAAPASAPVATTAAAAAAPVVAAAAAPDPDAIAAARATLAAAEAAGVEPATTSATTSTTSGSGAPAN